MFWKCIFSHDIFCNNKSYFHEIKFPVFHKLIEYFIPCREILNNSVSEVTLYTYIDLILNIAYLFVCKDE